MPHLHCIETGVINEVNDETAEHFVKHHPDEYEIVDGPEAPALTDGDDDHGGDLTKMKYKQLQELAKSIGVQHTGKAEDIIAAIEAAKSE